GRSDRVRTQHALAGWRADDEERDPCWMLLRRNRDFTHPSPRGAAVIADRRADQFRQGDDGHGATPVNSESKLLNSEFICPREDLSGGGADGASPLVQASAPRPVRV